MASALAIQNPDELGPHLEGWDRLALMRRQPYAAPDWMLSWWRHAAPASSRLLVVVVRDGGEVIGVAPWHQHRLRTGLRVARLLGTGHRVEPLALPGREGEVAGAVGAAFDALAGGPGALALDRIDARSPWPVLLARESPGGGRVADRELTGAPVVRLEGSTYEEWLRGHSRNFREQRTQARRRFEREGATIRMAEEPADVDAAIAAFARITADRWEPPPWGEPRGDGVEGMLHEAARAMVPAGRMRVWVLEVERAPGLRAAVRCRRRRGRLLERRLRPRVVAAAARLRDHRPGDRARLRERRPPPGPGRRRERLQAPPAPTPTRPSPPPWSCPAAATCRCGGRS